MNLEERESTGWALCFKDCQSLLKSSNLCIALCFALLVRHDAPLTLWLELGNVLLNRGFLLAGHFEIATSVLERDIQSFDLGLSTLDLSLLGGQGHLVVLHQLFICLLVLPLFSCILFDSLAEFLTHCLKDVDD